MSVISSQKRLYKRQYKCIVYTRNQNEHKRKQYEITENTKRTTHKKWSKAHFPSLDNYSSVPGNILVYLQLDYICKLDYYYNSDCGPSGFLKYIALLQGDECIFACTMLKVNTAGDTQSFQLEFLNFGIFAVVILCYANAPFIAASLVKIAACWLKLLRFTSAQFYSTTVRSGHPVLWRTFFL